MQPDALKGCSSLGGHGADDAWTGAGRQELFTEPCPSPASPVQEATSGGNDPGGCLPLAQLQPGWEAEECCEVSPDHSQMDTARPGGAISDKCPAAFVVGTESIINLWLPP